MRETSTDNIQIRVPKDFKEEVFKVAEDNCQNVSALIRKFLEDYVAANKK